jgi:lysozyme family protein
MVSSTFLQHTYLVITAATREKEERVEETIDVDRLIDALIEREGGFVENPADKGGPTCFGITQAVARASGYAGPMRQLPREEAAAIYRRLYWLRPRFDEVASRSDRIAAELFDTGVNMGPAVAVTFLQRALAALNRNGSDYPDLVPDGRIGAQTLSALDAFLRLRGKSSGETVLLRALKALQGERYLRLAERRPGNYILEKAGESWQTVTDRPAQQPRWFMRLKRLSQWTSAKAAAPCESLRL